MPVSKGNQRTPLAHTGRGRALLALAAAAFVDSGEEQALSILWPNMYRSLGVSVGQLGAVLGISKLINTVALPFWGIAADRVSRKALG